MQTEGASGVEALIAAVRPLLGAAFEVASAAPGFPNAFRVLAMSFRRLDLHQSCALVFVFVHDRVLARKYEKLRQ